MFYLRFPRNIPKKPAQNKPYSWEKEAKVVLTIEPNEAGRVKFRGTYWNARCLQPVSLAVGTKVKVTEIVKITLIVEPFYYPMAKEIKLHRVKHRQLNPTTTALRGIS